MSLRWCLALCPPSGTSLQRDQALPVRMVKVTGKVPWQWAPRSGEERLSLLRVCLPREPGGENGAGNQTEKSECLVEEGKLETGVKAAGKIVGCLGAGGGRGGREGLGGCREDGRRQRRWKAAGEEAFFAGSQIVIISAQFPGQKLLVYLNTSASRSPGSPDTIEFAFSPRRFQSPFAAMVTATVRCRVSHSLAVAAALGEGDKASPGDEGFAARVPAHLPVETLLLHSNTNAAGG